MIHAKIILHIISPVYNRYITSLTQVYPLYSQGYFEGIQVFIKAKKFTMKFSMGQLNALKNAF